MNLSRDDIDSAAEIIDLFDYSVLTYSGRDMYGRTCAAVGLPNAGKVTEFMVSLAVHLTENGRAEDALTLGREVRVDSMGRDVIAYWPDVEPIAD
jgi:hypothetical protein